MNVIGSGVAGTAWFGMEWKADKTRETRPVYKRRNEQLQRTRRCDLDTSLTHLFVKLSSMYDAAVTTGYMRHIISLFY